MGEQWKSWINPGLLRARLSSHVVVVIVGVFTVSVSSVTQVCGQTVIQTYAGYGTDDFFGGEVDWVGDLDGDGFGEVIIGAQRYTAAVNWEGRVAVRSGATDQELYSYEGTSPGEWLGQGVAGVGDVSGDGVPDFAAASWGSFLLVDSWIWSGADGGVLRNIDNFGVSVAAVGDLTGDGLNEVLFGDSGAFAGGMAKVIEGGTYSVLYEIPFPFQQFPGALAFGEEVAGMGDTTGDLVPDFVVGAPGSAGIPPCAPGFVMVYSGSDGELVNGIQVTTTYDRFGTTIADAGDLNRDGRADLFVGSPQCCNTFQCGTITGAVLAIEPQTGTILDQVDGAMPESIDLGMKLSSPGDIDGDGVQDVLAYSNSMTSGLDRVTAYSGATFSTIYTVPEPQVNKYLYGWSSAPAGDVDGDFFPDFLVGSPSMGTVLDRVELISGAPQGVRTFGIACPTSSGTLPRIAASGTPLIGSTVTVNLSQVDAGLSVLFHLGVSNTTWLGVPLPLRLGIIGMPGCDLSVSVNIALALTTTAVGPVMGVATVPLPIPNNPTLLGLSLYSQWFVVNPMGSGSFGATSKGLDLAFQ